MRFLRIAFLSLLASTPALAELPAGLHYDDAFAYFEVKSVGKQQNNGKSTHLYLLKADARVVGKVARGSAFRFVVKAGGKQLGEFGCKGDAKLRARMVMGNEPLDQMAVTKCYDNNVEIGATGDVTVEVYYYDDDTEKEYLARTHTVNIRRLTVARNGGGSMPHSFFVNQHAQTPVAVIDQVGMRENLMFNDGYSSPSTNSVFVYFSHSGGSVPGSLSIRCSVNGERVEFPQGGRPRPTRVHDSSALQAKLSGNNRDEDIMEFKHVRMDLPITWGDSPTPQYPSLDKLPGKWECKIRDDARNTYREFSFDVKDGLIQPHPEEATGLYFPNRVHLLAVKIPADSKVDTRTDPAAAKASGFYGRKWQSAEGKAMAGSVPAIGTPYPSSGR